MAFKTTYQVRLEDWIDKLTHFGKFPRDEAGRIPQKGDRINHSLIRYGRYEVVRVKEGSYKIKDYYGEGEVKLPIVYVKPTKD